MTAENETSDASYQYDSSVVAPPEVIQLWIEVGNGLDKNQTVVWKSAVESLDHALKYLRHEPRARTFVEGYMSSIISILVEQQPSKIGIHERNCVQDSLMLAVRIVAEDLAIQVRRRGTSALLLTLSHALNKKKAFYKGSKGGSWNTNQHHHMVGMPEVRLRTMEVFRAEDGFRRLHDYLQMRLVKKTTFPVFPWVHEILCAIYDGIPARATSETDQDVEEDAILISNDIIQFISACTDEELKKIPTEDLKVIQSDLQRIFDRLVATRRSSTNMFYAFWRDLVLRLIRSQSLPLKLFGWEQVADLIRACESHRPPPREYLVANAGNSFANGVYTFNGEITPDGYARQGTEFSYVLEIPSDDPNGTSKKLTLFRCTMRSQQKWWFLSEADEEQPGTDRDIDYYQHRAKDYEDPYPPEQGWVACKNSGVEPPPSLKAQGLLVPPGAEFETLEHHLAKWAIENEIVEQVLGDTTIHREVVSRSTGLIKFLAAMCARVPPSGSKYCLQASHLLFAWKTCTRKADAAVSLQVYQLLVSILPLCPISLALPLLQAIQASLRDDSEKRDYLFEVSEFCSALASGIVMDSKDPLKSNLSDEVREEVLNLLWSVLTHPEASSLKPYDSLKQYVTYELKVEPKGSEHRERFLQSCVTVLTQNERIRSAPVDEAQALRTVKLFDFVFRACPKPQAEKLTARDNGSLPSLILHELTAYLDRRKMNNKGTSLEDKVHEHALIERLKIIRHIFGLAMDPLSADSLKDLWNRCDNTLDREAVMVFISDASQNGKLSGDGPDNLVSAAISEEVCTSVFLDLFCSPKMNYNGLGPNGYGSFQELFSQVRVSFANTALKRSALDALWRICLSVESDLVAERAMNDLLAMYISLRVPQLSPNGDENGTDTMAIDENDDNFESRISECLLKLVGELSGPSSLTDLSIQRCLRILKAAIGETSQDASSTMSTISRLLQLSPDSNFDAAMRCLPHKMRGRACCRRIEVIAKGPSQRPLSTIKFSLEVHPLETLGSLKGKIAFKSKCPLASVKLVQINGRGVGVGLRYQPADPVPVSANIAADDITMDELGVVHGCEFVFTVSERISTVDTPVPPAQASRGAFPSNLSSVFFDDGCFAEKLHGILLSLLVTPPFDGRGAGVASVSPFTQKLVWDLLLAMPTDSVVANKVMSIHNVSGGDSVSDPMEVDSSGDAWSQLIDVRTFDSTVYTLMTIDSFLQPAPEALSLLPHDQRTAHGVKYIENSGAFRRAFIDGGGFSAVVQFFSASYGGSTGQDKIRRGNAVALRVLKSCLFGDEGDANATTADEAGIKLLQSLSDVNGLLTSLTSMVVDDDGISSSTVSDVLRFLSLLFQSPKAAECFVALTNAENFLVTLLLWDGGSDAVKTSSSISAAMQVRKSAHDLILKVPLLVDSALPWLINAVSNIDSSLESAAEFFDVLEKLVDSNSYSSSSRSVSDDALRSLATALCQKLAACPKPANETDANEQSTGVLCGCLKLLRALIEKGGGAIFKDSTPIFFSGDVNAEERWSTLRPPARGMLAIVANSFSSRSPADDAALVDLMGAIFDGFLAPNASTGVSICFDRESRRKGFEVVTAAARLCESDIGYDILVSKIEQLISCTAPSLRHRWGQFGSGSENRGRNRSSSKYSGLRNQGCTCYMNSVLQQLFMMPDILDSMCAAPLPTALRSSSTPATPEGEELVGKKISLQWNSGVSYDAIVESYNQSTGAHTIRYLPIQLATPRTTHHSQHEEVPPIPPALPDEFVLINGRPGKETGIFELVGGSTEADANFMVAENTSNDNLKESVDEAMSRHLFEEVQRTFIHLKEGPKGRCFDPRALVEACACLKLEFDVWQQNDASEFATKFLDRLEITLKKWAPEQFDYMDHALGIKQTKQKICKECGLKTNREEKLLNIDCQIRGKSDIHEALGAMTEVEIMEGSNKVFCDNCKKNTDTILRTAISTLPNILILSLKRFDLDFTTFETVKLNSRCAFGETLNLKPYTLEGLESSEQDASAGNSPMDTGETGKEALHVLPDEDYEYRLVGVLVHAGVAQGGHYYSFIKERGPGTNADKWYRFDDEDVTPFDPAMIESECFGGRVRKETKWPNGQLHTVEQEQFANALMLFYEKVKPTEVPEKEKRDATSTPKYDVSTGYDVYVPDVRTSTAAHRWQSFLFNGEFQSFLQDLLGYCRIPTTGPSRALDTKRQTWFAPAISMLISYVFDVLFYSSELGTLNDWVSKLEELLSSDRESAVFFVRNLARKTLTVSENWLRTFLLECPQKSIRVAAARIFSVATISAVFDEFLPFQNWSRAWKEQVAEIERSSGNTISSPMPTRLEGRWSLHEDVDQMVNGTASSIGIILSHMNVLLESIPRSWRFATEACLFIKNLAKLSFEGKPVFQRPMVNALLSARLAALLGRERSPNSVRLAFPGATMSHEVANIQAKAESGSSMHAIPMTNNTMLNSNDLNSQRGPLPTDYLSMLEALICVGGMSSADHVPLLHNSDEFGRSRLRPHISEKASKALQTIFEEFCEAGSPGLRKKELEDYLCIVEPNQRAVAQQKTNDIMLKYQPAAEGTGSKGEMVLNLEGFLAYYRDCVQSNDARLRNDLHVFGFRPDLSRRTKESRVITHGGRESLREPFESVALDVSALYRENHFDVGNLTTAVLLMTPSIFTMAYSVSEPLMQYLAALSVYRKDAEPLIVRTLQIIYQTPNDWSGNERIGPAVSVLQTIASTPGEHQQINIANIMRSVAKPARAVNFGCGLLEVTKALESMTRAAHYNNEVYLHLARYMEILRSLYKLLPVYHWMSENRPLWAFIERDLLDPRSRMHQQDRSDYSQREVGHVAPLDHNINSDSDVAGMNDSEDDEDSHYDTAEGHCAPVANDGPFQVFVQGAGNPAVDGVYSQDGFFSNACRYTKHGRWKDTDYKFYIFQCPVSNNTRHWYISIVPYGGNPGTSSDIDFYTAPVQEDCVHVPPKIGWVKANEGRDPSPMLAFRFAGDLENNGAHLNKSFEDNSDSGAPHAYV
ncbi:ubiquitin carboxyl-terminal hydrolase 9/24 [Fistulifera solaris]|uniref:Ubiquitin carboxyl-terminal hydrolase 9/24 n=1 Tax=Fistulifera solaris TaxID=1519565 RepID=A0A1Z5KLD6_FISSO|nr:ubiquitin carboxyl-terminal hydrolase 9/24 [Fistulifera solaris]|eukprot:GAX26841.1 ubiquitin carboxyl-terminal hydrolase 9/24 [Fistulifera solaris]